MSSFSNSKNNLGKYKLTSELKKRCINNNWPIQ